MNVEENHDVLKGDRYLIELVSQCDIIKRNLETIVELSSAVVDSQ